MPRAPKLTTHPVAQALYAQEGVTCANVDAPDNSETISYIEAKPYGVLPLLDEQCRLGERGADSNLGARVNDLNPSCKRAISELGQRVSAPASPDALRLHCGYTTLTLRLHCESASAALSATSTCTQFRPSHPARLTGAK